MYSFGKYLFLGTKVKVTCQGHNFWKMAVARALNASQAHLVCKIWSTSFCLSVAEIIKIFEYVCWSLWDKGWLIDWMVFYAAFNSISVISQWQLHYSCLSWVSPVLGWGSELSCPKTIPEKTQRIKCGSNPGPLDYESNTSPMSHAGPLWDKGNNLEIWNTI